MYLASACPCRTVTIFGPSNAAEWRPWKAPNRVVRSGGIARLESRTMDENDVAEVKTDDVSVSDVVCACEELFSPGA